MPSLYTSSLDGWLDRQRRQRRIRSCDLLGVNWFERQPDSSLAETVRVAHAISPNKRTFCQANGNVRFGSKAGMCGAQAHVCFRPIADIELRPRTLICSRKALVADGRAHHLGKERATPRSSLPYRT